MTDALYFISHWRDMLWDGLSRCEMPVLGVSFLTFFLTCFFLNLLIKLFILVVGDNDKGGSSRLDNNNHYIYKR